MKYGSAIIFTKNGNLLPWLYAKADKRELTVTERMKELYGKEKEIQLVLLIREEAEAALTNGKRRLICRIKCPINPLPIRGEFEVPSISAITSFLNANGWKKKETIWANMFR